MAIDARENINAQIMLARSLGGDIGGALGYRERERKRRERMRERMQLAQIQILGDPNLTPAEQRQAMLITSNLLQEGIGEDITDEMLQKTLGLGSYYESPLEKEYRQASIDAKKAQTKRWQSGLGFGSGTGAAGGGNLFGLRKYWTDERKKAVDAAYEKYDDMEKAYADPEVKLIQKRINDIDNQLRPQEERRSYAGLDIKRLEKLDQELSEGMASPPAPVPPQEDTRESLTTAEELIDRDALMQGAFGQLGIAGPPASAQTKFPIPTPSLEKRSTAAKPKTKEEFLATVARLKASPETIGRARTYYEKWVGEFKWQ